LTAAQTHSTWKESFNQSTASSGEKEVLFFTSTSVATRLTSVSP